MSWTWAEISFRNRETGPCRFFHSCRLLTPKGAERVVFAFMMLAAMVLLSAASTPTAPLEQGWQFRWGDDLSWATAAWSAAEGWSDHRIPGNPPERPKGERWLWLRVRVPEGDWREPALKLDGVIGHWELFLDGQKLAQHPREDGLEAKGAHGMPWHLINLPPGAAGKILTIRSRTSYFLAGVVGRASVGERSVLIEDVVRADVPRAVVGALMVVIGLLALLILAPAGVRLARGFALFAVGAGLYTLNYTQLKQLAFDVPANLWFLAWCFSVAVMPIGTATYLAEVFHPEPPMLRRARQVQTFLGLVYGVTVLSAWAALTLWGSAVEPASTAAFVAVGGAVRLSMVVGSVLVVWLLITRSHRARGEERTQARILLLGVGALFVVTLMAISASFGVSRYGSASYVYLGLLAITLSWAVVAGRVWSQARLRAVAFARELEDRSREKEAMLRDLHDGIGGVTTNIRLLAEIGGRDGGNAAEALSTIAELSTEGLAELRAFTQTLDEAAVVTWPVLCSELRRYGGQVIESYGKTFVMNAKVEDEGRPTSALCLAVLRVFREALTNIVKHARATRVEVDVVIDGSGFSLKISDDGEGGGQGGGLDTGRGMTNMHSRARELGGELQVSRDGGTKLWLRLPITRNSPGPGAERAQ